MHVSLTPELEKRVKEKVASGLYNNASEVIREALRLALRTEAENEWLKREAAIGFAQLEAGETVRITTKKQFLSLARGTKSAR
jgi:antitoxin ParD1/3/4